VESELVERSPGEHGLVFLPLLAGERSPGWRGEARGVITGLSLATQVQDIYAAGLEGIVCRIGIVYQLLQGALPGEPDIIASGGAFYHSPALLQMIADALGRPVWLTQVSEVSARGAAMLALCALGAASDLNDFPLYNRGAVAPDPNRHARYQELTRRQQELYNRLISGHDQVDIRQPH
jgi:gluconokinase